MKSNVKVLAGIIIVVVILLVAYLGLGGGFSITGAIIGSRECVGSDGKAIYSACSKWAENGYTDKTGPLKVLSDSSAKQLCEKMLTQYKLC